MEHLTQQDFHTFLAFLSELYTVRDLDSFRRYLISALPQVVPSELTSYNEMHTTKGVSENWEEPANTVTRAMQQVWERHMNEHPVLTYNLRTRNARACKISDFLTQSQFHRLGLYNEFYRRLGIEDVMAFALSVRPPLVVGVGLQRDRRTFSERERLLLNLLRPHLNQAYQNAQVVTRMQQELMLVRQGMERSDQGVIALTREGHVQMMTSRARQWMAEYFGGSGQADRLPETLQRWLRHQQGPLMSIDEIPAPREPLVVEREGRRLVIRLLSDAGQSLLLVEEQVTALLPVALEPLGLTQRETDVLAWVALGRSNYAIGVLLGISEPTVKKHLEHIYAKLGVWNRTEAVARVRAVLTSSASGSFPL